MTTPRRRKFFLSLTVTLNGLASGAITKDDLDQGLFCFLTGPNWPLYHSGKSPAHKLLGDALTAAVASERVVWLDDGTGGAFDRINDMLARQGLKQMRFYKADGFVQYSQTEVAVRCSGLECVYRAGA